MRLSPANMPSTPPGREQPDSELQRLQLAALEATATAVVITDRNGLICWSNRAFTALTGYSAEEVRGQNTRLLKSGRHDRAFYQNLWETVLAGQTWQAEMVNRRKDGSFYTELNTINPVRNGQGEPTHFIAVKEDVSARNAAEAALAENEQRFRAVVQTVGDAIIAADRQGLITLWNPAAEVIFGYSAAEAVGQPLSLIMPSRLQPGHAAGLQRAVAAGHLAAAGKAHELSGRRKDGTEFPLELTLAQATNGPGMGFISVIRDISARKQAESERERLIRELQDTLAKLKTLSGLIPICAACKKIRDDRGFWQQVETYVAEHSQAKFSHGICPDCMRALYPEMQADLERAPASAPARDSLEAPGRR